MFIAALVLAASAVVVQDEKISAAERAAIAGDPRYVPQKLRLVDVPKPTGPAYSLFNGKDLDDWEAWLGYPDPALT